VHAGNPLPGRTQQVHSLPCTSLVLTEFIVSVTLELAEYLRRSSMLIKNSFA